jgi:hypothetical protein
MILMALSVASSQAECTFGVDHSCLLELAEGLEQMSAFMDWAVARNLFQPKRACAEPLHHENRCSLRQSHGGTRHGTRPSGLESLVLSN